MRVFFETVSARVIGALVAAAADDEGPILGGGGSCEFSDLRGDGGVDGLREKLRVRATAATADGSITERAA